MFDKYMNGMDVYNEIENCWDELISRSFTARYAGYDKLGNRINPGDKISKSSGGGYILIETE